MIAFDAANGGISGSGVTSYTFQHTCSGSDRILFVAAFGIATGVDITGVTYDGVAMTQIGPTRYSQSNLASALFMLVAPATGENDVVVSTDTSCTVRASSSSYTGVSQTDPINASNGDDATDSGSAESFETSLTTDVDNCWVVGSVNGTDEPIDADNGETKRDEQGTGNNRTIIADSSGAVTPAGSVTFGFTQESSANWALQIAAFEPVGAAPTTPTVDTDATDEITTTTATLNGDITDVGSGNADTRGFVYSTTSHSDPGDTAPAASDYEAYTTESGDFGTGVFDAGITSLTPDDTYYVRAWAHNDDGYAYGDEVTFDTDAITYAISGTVTLSASPIEGATIRCIRQSDNVALTAQTTDASGNYSFTGLDNTELYHLAVEYESGETTYNALSYWDIVPVEV